MGIQLLPERCQLPQEVLGRVKGRHGSREAPGGAEVDTGGRLELTWTEASLLWQLSKPRVWNTSSRTAIVEADTSGLLSVRATLGPCRLYFPWGGKARVGLGGAQLEARSELGQGMPLTTFLPRLSRASAICAAIRSVPDTRKAMGARRKCLQAQSSLPGPSANSLVPNLCLSLNPDLSVYELSRTLPHPLEPWVPSPCSVPWVQQAISWLALTCPHLSQKPVPNPILSSWSPLI